jgi:hypothetical protein
VTQKSGSEDRDGRQRHQSGPQSPLAASDADDFEAEHAIYRENAVLEYPQSGERIRGRRNIQASRVAQPNRKRFTVRRILGAGDLWVTEFILAYDGRPSYSVSIMEFRDGEVARETQYFAAPSSPGLRERIWLSAWNEIGATAARPRVLERAELPVDTVELARFLIGKMLVRVLDEEVAGGRIVETEV